MEYKEAKQIRLGITFYQHVARAHWLAVCTMLTQSEACLHYAADYAWSMPHR